MDELIKSFSSQTSLLVKSFWAGKLIQELHLTEDDLFTASSTSKHPQLPLTPSTPYHFSQEKPLHILISEALECLGKEETSLSPRVHSIITGNISCSLSDGDVLLYPDFTINWKTVSRYIDNSVLLEKSNLTAGAERCSLIAELVYQQYLSENKLSITLKGIHNYSWTSQPQLFVDCVTELTADGGPQVNTTLLLITAGLERALGDVYLSVSSYKRCPSLLRDLLETRELEDTFSPIAMCLLRSLIGPPSGINLRNVLWHGFADKEVPCKFAVLMLVIAASLGKILSTKHTPKIVHREFVTFPQEEQLGRVFRELGPMTPCRTLRKLISSSFFIHCTMIQTWEYILQVFEEECYYHCVCLLLPSLEHSLRRVFSCVNNCPERALTAETDTLYTTFDEILSPVLASGEPNNLIDELGMAKMEMLLDVLVHPEGPRLRDRVSHGEVEYNCLSRGMANYLLSLVVLFCVKYSLIEPVFMQANDTLVKFLDVESSYVSLFHPFSLLRRETEQLNDELAQWETVPISPDWRQDTNIPHLEVNQHLHCRILDKLGRNRPHQFYHRGMLQQLLTCAWCQLKTLFVPKQQLELVGVVRRTVSNTTKAVIQIRRTATSRYSQHKRLELRSRQRNNYRTLISSLPLYEGCVQTVVLLVVLSTTCLRSPAGDLGKSIKFYKKILQFSENFYSQTLPSHNRWEEAKQLCNSLATTIAEQEAIT